MLSYRAMKQSLEADGHTVKTPEPRKRKRSYEESDNQISFFKWWRATHDDFHIPECLVYAIPNGSALGTGREDWQVLQRIIRGKRLVAEGLTNGVFDIFVSVPRIRPHGTWYHGCYLEMKKKDGTVSPAQVTFKAAAEAFCYRTAICYSDREAIDCVTTYLTK